MYRHPSLSNGACSVLSKLAAILPFSPFRGLVWKVFDRRSRSVLDLGSGKGGVGVLLSLRRWHGVLVGTERYSPYVRFCKQSDSYEDIVVCDLRVLPFRPKSFDAVFCIEVLEHLTWKDGTRLLADAEQLAKHQVIFSLPVGWEPSKEYDGNPLRRHLSAWTVDQFLSRGYEVHGQYPAGFKLLYWASHFIPFYLFVYRYPRFSSHMICHKKLRYAGRKRR